MFIWTLSDVIGLGLFGLAGLGMLILYIALHIQRLYRKLTR